MFGAPSITFDAPLLLLIGLALAATTVGVAAIRRPSAPPLSHVLFALGMILLATAAGGPRLKRDATKGIAVMVDYSASTRGASYRNEAALRARLDELLPDQPLSIVRFGQGDAGARRTTWVPPPPHARAVLLFSDGRFEPPVTSPPVYTVVDPSLEQRGQQLFTTVTNGGGATRTLSITGGGAPVQQDVPGGRRTVLAPATTRSATYVAKLSPGDAWPENDALSLTTPPPALSERWWVGESAPQQSGWRVIAASELPADPVAYLAPAVIVLSNTPAEAIADAPAQRLQQYVRDLGGALVIVGGDRAFAAGGYDGSLLGALAPLASSPPTPLAHWMVLIDSSGSMAGPLNGGTRHAAAVAAARNCIAQLPPHDLLSVGGFADQLRWWTRAQAVNAFAHPEVPAPRGPTNVEAALRSAVQAADKSAANQLVLLTDGQVDLPSPDALAAVMKAANVRLHVFAIGAGAGLGALRTLADLTGGTFAQERDAAQWAGSLARFLRQAAPRHWMTTSIPVSYDQRILTLSNTTATHWNRTWLKPDSEEVARGTSGDEPVPMAAQANLGSGKVLAVAFRPPDAHVDALAGLVQSPPRDPRLNVTWRAGRELTLTIDAATDGAPLNGLSPTLVLSSPSGSPTTHAVPQTGPGRYALSLPAPSEPRLATLTESGRVIDRYVVAGRYPPEFDGIGSDQAAMTALATRTGGRVIEPQDRNAIHPPLGETGLPVASYAAGAGALLLALGLTLWRRPALLT